MLHGIINLFIHKPIEYQQFACLMLTDQFMMCVKQQKCQNCSSYSEYESFTFPLFLPLKEYPPTL